MSDLIPEDHYLYGRMGRDEERLDRARRGLPDVDDTDEGEDALDRFIGEDADEAPPEEGREPLGPYHSEDHRRGRPYVRPRPFVWSAHEALQAWAGERAGVDRAEPAGLDRPGLTIGATTIQQVAELVEETEGFEAMKPTLWAVYVDGATMLHRAFAIAGFMAALEVSLASWRPRPRIRPKSRAEQIADIQEDVERARLRRPWRPSSAARKQGSAP